MSANLRSRLQRMREAARQTVADAGPARAEGGDPGFPAGWSHVADGVRRAGWCSQPLGLATQAPIRLAAFARRFSAETADPRRVAFFDFETTGLSGGAGTIAFLAAIGRIDEAGSVRVVQYFLDDYPAERAFIQHVSEALLDVDAIATYNGSSFDMPLLLTRRAMHGLDALPAVPHVDVLHPVRRLYRTTIGACALSSIEATILDCSRDGDIPGSEVPQVWFDFVKQGQCDRLQQVFVHNRLDIVSLARLFFHVGLIAGGAAEDPLCDPIGRAELESRLDSDRAERTLRGALASGDLRASRALMRLYRQQERWQERLDMVPLLPDDPAGLFSRSVYAERVRHDIDEALALALRSSELARPGSTLRQRALRRVDRLRIVLAGGQPSGSSSSGR